MKSYYYIVLFLGVVLKFTIANIEDDLNNLNLSSFGNDLQNLTSKIPTKEEVEQEFKKKCEKNGGPEAYEHVTKSREELETCVKGLVNVEQLQEEMEKAKPTGDLDVVFKKYCKKSPDLTTCIRTFTTAAEECLEPEERKNKDIVLNVTESLLSFICFKEGDRIALFIAEGGPDCLNASQDAIKECVQTVFHKQIDLAQGSGIENIQLLFRAEDCNNFSKLQKCVVKELERCKEPTPANIVDALFNYVRKVTPCSKFTNTALSSTADKDVTRGAGNNLSPVEFLTVTIGSYVLLRLLH